MNQKKESCLSCERLRAKIRILRKDNRHLWNHNKVLYSAIERLIRQQNVIYGRITQGQEKH